MTAAILAALAAAASAHLPRVMSADVCADQFVLALADREQIAALSPDADKEFSYMRAAAAGLAQARPDAEHLVRRRPDVLLRFWGGDAQRLSRFGAKVVTLDYVADFAGVKDNIRRAGARLAQDARAEALIAEMDVRLAALAQRDRLSLRALYYTQGGATAGAGTIIDAIFGAAGVRNAATTPGWSPAPLERLALEQPDLVVAGFFDGRDARTSSWAAGRHSVVQTMLEGGRTVHLSADVLSCPAWFSLDAAEAIADAAEERP